MGLEIDKIFSNSDLTEEDILECERLYSYIVNNFNNKWFDFTKTDNISYLKLVKHYLKINGYGYLSKKVDKYINNKNFDNIEMAKLMMDCNVINKQNVTMKSDIKNKQIISYEKKSGLRYSFNIKYSVKVPFAIYSVAYANSEYINYKLSQSLNNSKNITIEIKIDNYKSVEFTETLVIYTSYGIDKLEFTVKCNNEINNDIEYKSIYEYLEFCKKNPYEASNIFNKYEFRSWLENKDYITQLINYDEATNISNDTKNYDAFQLFCILNDLYLENYQSKKSKIEEENKDNQEEIKLDLQNVLLEVENIYVDEKHDLSANNHEEDNNDISEPNEVLDIESNDEVTNSENKNKSLLSGIKKIFSRLKRK